MPGSNPAERGRRWGLVVVVVSRGWGARLRKETGIPLRFQFHRSLRDN